MTDRRPLPSLTAIVPGTDGPPTLGRCTAAIAAATDGPEELVVVDDPALRGPAAARNHGAEGATGDILVFVDADVLVAANAFARIRAAFAADAGLDALFGSYDDSPEAAGAVSLFRNLLHHHVHQEGAGAASTFWAGLGAVRREAFERAGGFDAARFPDASVEDIELGMRLSARGARIELDPALRGTHLKRWTFVLMVRTDFARRAIPWARLLLESRGAPSTLNLGVRHRLSVAAAVALAGALAARRPAAAAGAGAGLVALNHSFYGLLARRGGRRAAVTGVGLHALHHLTSAAAVPVAVALQLRERHGT